MTSLYPRGMAENSENASIYVILIQTDRFLYLGRVFVEIVRGLGYMIHLPIPFKETQPLTEPGQKKICSKSAGNGFWPSFSLFTLSWLSWFSSRDTIAQMSKTSLY